jgi:dephospho-CoA kinase
MRRLGLTGSIGMGKSTTALMFAEAGVPVYDADAAVHALYAGEAAPLIKAAFPGTVTDGVVDRPKLGSAVIGKPEAMACLEQIVHPLVRAREQAFQAKAAAAGHRLVVLDIPLLFETKGEARVDAVVVVSAPADVQRSRVLARPGMTPDRFEAIHARQMPDAEKRRRAHFIVDTGRGLDSARHQVRAILRAISG